jgi:Regulator of ribonuclease activity B
VARNAGRSNQAARLKSGRKTVEEDYVRLFRRTRDDEPVDMNERSPELGVRYKDLAVLGQLMKNGADLSATRHVVYYSYAPNEGVAQAMGQEAETNGFAASIREPLLDFPGQWSVTCEIHAVTSPNFVREADDFFQGLADRHGADYDGWEASV